MPSLIVPLAAKGQRLDVFISQADLSLSRARVQKLIEQGLVTVGAKVGRGAFRLKGGEQVEWTVPAPTPAIPQAEALPLEIVYQDKQLLVINKPAGMVVHPGAGHAGGTVVNALLHHVDDLQGVGGVLRPGIVHRLDKDTSGLLVIAKDEGTLKALQKLFAGRQIEKVYWALVVGKPAAQATISTRYGRHPKMRKKFTGKVGEGKSAVTHYRVLAAYDETAWLEVILETGRTHQIRVHLSEAGYPLLGDAVYTRRGVKSATLAPRQMLHARGLAFEHPKTGKKLAFEADAPEDFERVRAGLAKGS